MRKLLVGLAMAAGILILGTAGLCAWYGIGNTLTAMKTMRQLEAMQKEQPR